LESGSWIISLNKYGRYIIVFCWLLLTAFYYCHFSLFTGLEADKYIEEANYFIAHGNFAVPKHWFYCATIFIIIFAIKIKAGLFGAFIIQALINLCACLFFYKALKTICRYDLTALLIVLVLLIFWPYQSWIVYLYTESVFYSSILILASVLILYRSHNARNILLIIAALIFVIISRPLGILFIIPTLLYFYIGLKKRTRIILLPLIIIGLCLAGYISNIVFSASADTPITLAVSQECIVCGIIPVTHSSVNLSSQGTPLYQLYYYLANNFNHFLHFGMIKLKYFFMMTRSYYSVSHNIFLLIFAIPLYLLSIIRLFIADTNKAFYVFQLSALLLFCFTIMLQCDDYHNRFVLALFPFFIIMAAQTVEHFVACFLARQSKQ
jgi:hypothetical protein